MDYAELIYGQLEHVNTVRLWAEDHPIMAVIVALHVVGLLRRVGYDSKVLFPLNRWVRKNATSNIPILIEWIMTFADAFASIIAAPFGLRIKRNPLDREIESIAKHNARILTQAEVAMDRSSRSIQIAEDAGKRIDVLSHRINEKPQWVRKDKGLSDARRIDRLDIIQAEMKELAKVVNKVHKDVRSLEQVVDYFQKGTNTAALGFSDKITELEGRITTLGSTFQSKVERLDKLASDFHDDICEDLSVVKEDLEGRINALDENQDELRRSIKAETLEEHLTEKTHEDHLAATYPVTTSLAKKLIDKDRY